MSVASALVRQEIISPFAPGHLPRSR